MWNLIVTPPHLETENDNSIERKCEVNSLGMVGENTLLLEEVTQRRWIWI